MNEKTDGEVRFNPWSPGGTFVDQKMAITSPVKRRSYYQA